MVERSGLFDVVIVGGGFSGLGMGIKLREAGIDNFVILEKGEQLGGTWRDNVYPGCACDVPSHLYSFSFAPKHDWSHVFARQGEIQSYLLDVADRSSIHSNLMLKTLVEEARWDEESHFWSVETNRGTFRAKALVAAVGPLHEPRMPELPGMEDFVGSSFHSARWQHDCELAGKRVAVVGTGSSAIQLVPEIQPDVEEMFVFQRTPGWVLPKPDYEIADWEKTLLRLVPGLRKGIRSTIYGLMEGLQVAQRYPAVMRQIQRVGLELLRRQVPDPDLRAALTPDWALGCKRLLLSNTWYPAIQAQNVTLVRSGVSAITKNGVVGSDGIEREVDHIIYATGFHATDPPIADHVYGRWGKTLAETWNGSPKAYKGTTVSGFPNMFFTLGPNLGNGHTSALIMLEAQIKYVLGALRAMKRGGLTSVDIKSDVQDKYNRKIQKALKNTVWNAGGCSSWYLDRNGNNSSIYPWTTIDLRRRLARFDIKNYECEQTVRDESAVQDATSRPGMERDPAVSVQ